MSFENDYRNRKDWRKPYATKAKRWDASCRSHGGCSWCLNNRLHSTNKRLKTAKEKVAEHE